MSVYKVKPFLGDGGSSGSDGSELAVEFKDIFLDVNISSNDDFRCTGIYKNGEPLDVPDKNLLKDNLTEEQWNIVNINTELKNKLYNLFDMFNLGQFIEGLKVGDVLKFSYEKTSNYGGYQLNFEYSNGEQEQFPEEPIYDTGTYEIEVTIKSSAFASLLVSR